MTRAIALVAGVLAASTLTGLAGQEGQEAQPEETIFADAWADRLEALSPDDPEAYYRLGEEVADVAQGTDQVSLARHLYVVAFELERARGGRSGLGASVCLALASIERLDSRRAWLRALAGAMDERYAANEWFQSTRREVDPQTALTVARVLGHARAGDGHLARVVAHHDDGEVRLHVGPGRCTHT